MINLKKNIMYMIIFILLFVLIISCNKKNANDVTNDVEGIENIIELLSENDIFDNNFMGNYFWSLDNVGEADYNWHWGFYIHFNIFEGNYYGVIPNGPPFEPWVIGNYSFDNDKIILNPTKVETYGREIDRLFTERLELERVTIENSLFFTEGLMGNGFIFGAGKAIFGTSDNNGGFRPKKGDIRYVNGHLLIMDDFKESELISNANIRKGPGTNYDNYELKVFKETTLRGDDIFEIRNSLPQGRFVRIIGHTEFEETHNNLTGYWYYCRIMSYMNEEIVNFGWIFGPLLEIE
ncbi:MAG: hypothetical protein FWD28_07975 [Treponema sp.]|nr:hypothetical protein [Treponema sp.]